MAVTILDVAKLCGYSKAIKWNFVVSAIGFCLFEFIPDPIIAIFGSGKGWNEMRSEL